MSDFGRKNRKGSKPVEYAYMKDELADTETAQPATGIAENGEKTVEVNDPEGTLPSSDEN